MDRVKREDVEETVHRLEPRGTKTSIVGWRDRLLCAQTLLLLEIRDLLADSVMKLANPITTVRLGDLDLPFEPGRIVAEPPRELRIFGFDDLKSMGYSEAAIEKLREEAIASTKPSWRPDPPTRTTWLSAEDGKAEFACAACRRLVKVREDQMRGLKGPWITLECNRCRHKHELDGRHLDGDIGKMMRVHFPDEPEKGPGKITPTKAMCEPCAAGNCRGCKGHKVCDHYHAWEGEAP